MLASEEPLIAELASIILVELNEDSYINIDSFIYINYHLIKLMKFQ